jgi:hypothetical protein
MLGVQVEAPKASFIAPRAKGAVAFSTRKLKNFLVCGLIG